MVTFVSSHDFMFVKSSHLFTNTFTTAVKEFRSMVTIPPKRISPNLEIPTSITPFGATNGASEIVSLARAKLGRGTSN